MLKELILSGNVAIFQMISMRNKETGLYLPTMDGNVNSMLHRIYNNLDNINKVIMTLPHESLIDPIQLQDLYNINETIFESKIKFDHFDNGDLYGKNVGETRKNVLAANALHFNYDDLTLIVSEFPIYCFSTSSTAVEKVYNYNWNAVDDSNELLSKSLRAEMELAEDYETYLFSDVQLHYWNQQTGSMNTYVRRSTNIYNKELFNLLADRYAANAATLPEVEMVKLLETMESKVVFFSMRVDDPRYAFDEVLTYCESVKVPLIITNPTNAPVTDSPQLIDLSNSTDKRTLYFAVLKSLRPHDTIFHYETDMHVSLIEQLSITEARVLHEIERIDEYLN